MSDVEHRVRDLLRRHAAEAPAGATLLTTVRTESRRRARRTRAVVAAAVAVLAGIGVTVPLRLAAGPGTVTVAEPSALTEPSGPVTVTFPLSPAPVDGVVAAPDVRLEAGLPTLSLPMPGGGTATLTVRPTRPAGPVTTPVPVRGVQGFLAGTADAIVWQEGPEQWFELRADPAVPADHLAGFAKSLVATPVTAPAPFTFAVVPAGYAVDNISPGAVTFCPPDLPFDASFVGKITVMLGVTAERSTGRPVDVAGHPGTLTGPQDGYVVLQVDLGDGRLLVVQSAASVPLPEPDLLRFAAGITVTPAATPGRG
ncbi:hypothetical protein [Dactylosporangium sp. NPDC005555]|uniref:hypothetical protein n=1 Tax=Dactylosporangium sp. NPDC005555 TaxID=3154889 RepID=UPI0033AD44A8